MLKLHEELSLHLIMYDASWGRFLVHQGELSLSSEPEELISRLISRLKLMKLGTTTEQGCSSHDASTVR
eukprot:18894-Eustigmatos_ZCMA.PRE.1